MRSNLRDNEMASLHSVSLAMTDIPAVSSGVLLRGSFFGQHVSGASLRAASRGVIAITRPGVRSNLRGYEMASLHYVSLAMTGRNVQRQRLQRKSSTLFFCVEIVV